MGPGSPGGPVRPALRRLAGRAGGALQAARPARPAAAAGVLAGPAGRQQWTVAAGACRVDLSAWQCGVLLCTCMLGPCAPSQCGLSAARTRHALGTACGCVIAWPARMTLQRRSQAGGLQNGQAWQPQSQQGWQDGQQGAQGRQPDNMQPSWQQQAWRLASVPCLCCHFQL